MKRLAVGEHTRIGRGEKGPGLRLEEVLYDRLRRLDQEGRPERERVFDWHDGHMRTTAWVGVVQVPGLQLEVLPKIDAKASWGGVERVEARRNLLHMLAVGGSVPVRTRDMARLVSRPAPLSETLIALFAERLKEELLRGPERTYVPKEENLKAFKGKLMVAEQVRMNAAHRERFACRFDEFSEDTRMNRIFRATCQTLLSQTRTAGTQEALKHCLLLLEGTSDASVQDADFDAVAVTRQNRRFEDALRFSRLVLAGRSPAPEGGRHMSFSLLFDMNRVFERFVAAVLKRHVAPLVGAIEVHPQAAHRRRHLFESDGRGVLQLAPDILVEGFGKRLVMDTKWKVLSRTNRAHGGVGDGDLYQLHAYTHRYGCDASVLLYPELPFMRSRDFHVVDGSDSLSGKKVLVRHIRLHRDLQSEKERKGLVEELANIVREGLGLAISGPHQGAAA